MPHIRARGTTVDDVKTLSRITSTEISELCKCSVSDLSWEVTQTQFIVDGAPDGGYPIVEFLWFDRGQEVKNKIARILDEALKQRGYSGDRAIIFSEVDQTNYFECGNHF